MFSRRNELSRWIAGQRRDEFFWLRVVGGATAIGLAITAIASDGVNATFLILAGAAAFVIAFPWQRLSGLKAGPLELSLTQGQIKAVVDSFEIEGEAKERLGRLLSRLKSDIELAKGGRVLWVDDVPHRVIAERRLFRALRIETVMIPSSRDAAEVLRRDNDFDLVITSLYKREEVKTLRKETVSDDRRPGVLFVQWLRGTGDATIARIYGKEIENKVVNNLPVIFYVAKVGMDKLRKAIVPAAELEPGVELSQKMEDFVAKAIRMLADARANPISVPAEKELF
jgi:hypothetical protein